MQNKSTSFTNNTWDWLNSKSSMTNLYFGGTTVFPLFTISEIMFFKSTISLLQNTKWKMVSMATNWHQLTSEEEKNEVYQKMNFIVHFTKKREQWIFRFPQLYFSAFIRLDATQQHPLLAVSVTRTDLLLKIVCNICVNVFPAFFFCIRGKVSNWFRVKK